MSAFVNFEVDRLKKKKMMKKISKTEVWQFMYVIVYVYLHTLRVLYDRETLVEPCYMSEKAYNCSVQEL